MSSKYDLTGNHSITSTVTTRDIGSRRNETGEKRNMIEGRRCEGEGSPKVVMDERRKRKKEG